MSLTQSARRDSVGSAPTTEVELSPDALLDVLDADYTEAILEAIHDEAKPARALVEECGASRPTIYRRLNTLQEAGLVESRMTLESDGHHRTVFEATLDSISIDVTGDGLTVSVSTKETAK
ncbi:MAG: putative transcriptional regulator [Haloarculaceae archaeon]|jgi:predicted transcriptional regulator